MSNRKFFSGLPATMMARGTNVGPNRQQSNFYWPDEANTVTSPRNRMRNRSLSTASIISQSQASTDTEESRRRRNNDMSSRIEFYDMVDTTDTESVYGRKVDPTRNKKLETLKSRIEFYDYKDESPQNNNNHFNSYNDEDVNSVIEVVQNNQEVKNISNKKIESPEINNNNNNKISITPNNNTNNMDDLTNSVNKMSVRNNKQQQQQYVDSYSESEEDADYRFKKAYRQPIERNSAQKYRRPPLPQQQLPPQQARPRRHDSHFFDDYDDDNYDRYFDSASIRSNRSRYPRAMPSRRIYSPEISDDDFYEQRRREPNRIYQATFSPEREFRNPSRYGDFYAPQRDDRRMSMQRNANGGYASEMDNLNSQKSRSQPQQNNIIIQQQSAPPSTTAAESPPAKAADRTNTLSESRRRYNVNLKSNIFHTDNEYDEVVGKKKPLSVREFAGNHRIGVGLPDLD